MTTLLDDVTETTPRSTVLGKLRKAAETIFGLEQKLAAAEHAKQDARVGRLQEIEERVRAKWSHREQDVIQLLVSSTYDEWSEAHEFLGDFEDLLPIALHRVHEGAKLALDRLEDASA